ncbi:MAG: hypothetical protein ACE5OZ_16645 [Candidatus Heimdallarchaeota archaeon]
MAKAGNKKVSSTRLKRGRTSRKVLKVVAYTAIAKPLNGAFPSSKQTHFLKLYAIPYKYMNSKGEQKGVSETYFIKGLRGALRYSAMKVSYDLGIEVCHTSDRLEDSSGNSLIPDGFHPLGSCSRACLIHQIFGSKGKEGLISVFAHPISSINHKTADIPVPIQKVHLSFENRICKTFDGRIVQNFSERYFSGVFSFEIDVSRCSSLHIGFLIQAILACEKLGRGYNAGYGHIDVQEFSLISRHVQKNAEWNGNTFKVKKDVQEKPLQKEVNEAFEEWEKFVSSA